MFRGTAPRLAILLLASAAVLPVTAPAQAAPPQERTVRVFDFAYDPVPIQVEAGDTVVWVLDQSAQATHSVTSDDDGGFTADLVPGTPDNVFRRKFTTAGKFAYYCRFHLFSNSMVGQVQVTDPPPPTTTTTTEPPTTTTTAPPPTTTTTAPPPPPTTTTTRPRPTTTTTQPPAAPPTTQPPASASTDDHDTTDTTARATTTTGKPTTTTTGKKKPAATTTTKAPETTTTSAAPALPAEWIPTPDLVPGGAPTTTTTEPGTEVAAGHESKKGKGGGGGGFPVAVAGALGLLVLGGGVWAWYHRSSRYLPA